MIILTKIVVIKRNCSMQVTAYLNAQWMMVSHLIWTEELSLTTWGNTLFRRKILTQLDTDQQTDSYPEDDTPSAVLDETDSLPEDDTLSAVLDETVP